MQSFEIKLGSLVEGVNAFRMVADDVFFGSFEGSELLGGRVEVECDVEDEGDSLKVGARLSGTVKVVCDRCLGELTLPVETEFEEEIEAAGPSVDLSQIVYDYICTALPLQRTHPEGECDADTVRYLSK